ncbi:MAG: MMPL family transporter [Proteobacteria bacterium]|nr:MMPL family transporter [Pseudomonadota bacterium]
MLKYISYFCSRFPWLVFIVVIAITVAALQQVKEKAYFEADMAKFMPKDIPAVKSDDYSKKNFNYQETLLIGVGKKSGSILEVPVLRSIEKIALELKNLKGTKTFQSKLTGKTETLTLPIGIDQDSVGSIANLEDAILDKETGSVVSGSVIKKLKKDFGIASPPGKEEMLPESDEDLEKIIPGLRERVLGDRSFVDNVLSSDLQAATIRASMVRRWDYMKRYVSLELSTAMDEKRLKARFQGMDSTFPFRIYGKTIDGITIDDAYIENQAARVRKETQSWLDDFLEVAFDDESELKELFEGEMTAERFLAVMDLMERSDFFMHPKVDTWAKFTVELHTFMLEQIDPFSRENLEFQFNNVEDIYDLAELYGIIQDILKKHAVEGVEFYVAGHPVVMGVFTDMVSKDTLATLPLAVLVVFVVLAISFRSVRGVVIPSVTVILAVFWTLGTMAALRVPFTITTSALPVILLAIGTAYGIHLLNRYSEDAANSTDRKEIVRTTVQKIGAAVVMAAITTMAGFISLASSHLAMIQHYGIFAAVGIFYALILSLTLTPAMLVLWKLPRKKADSHGQTVEPTSLVTNFFRSWTLVVIDRPKTILGGLLIVFILAGLLTTRNRFESSLMSNFLSDNPLYVSDLFINKKLTGTTNINLVFKFRDRINLDSPDAQRDFREHIDGFALAWNDFIARQPALKSAAILGIAAELREKSTQLPKNLEEIEGRLRTIRNMLDEEYAIETVSEEDTADGSEGDDELESLDEADDGLDDLGGLSDDTSETDQDEEASGPFADLSEEQISGLQDIVRRLGQGEENWEETGTIVLRLRELKATGAGIRVQRQLNLLQDFMAVDIKQPVVLHKLNDLYDFLKAKKTPQVLIEGEIYSPTGFVFTPVDFVRKFYKVFYHDDNPAFNRLPDVENDGFEDKTLTDRSIIGVVLNQALSASRDNFEAAITPDLKEFQVQIMIREGSNSLVDAYLKQTMVHLEELFPEDDPYIESISSGGAAPTSIETTRLISESQVRSIMLAFLFVFVVTFFIFRSAIGGLYSLVPLLFTVILNFGLISLIGGEITVGVMMVASISIGTGVDYTIHFLERFKIQLRGGDSLAQAYTTTVLTSGKAIILNAAAVAFGFLVLLFSSFHPNIIMGLLMAATMVFSSLGALTLLPALILVTRPRFLEKVRADFGTSATEASPKPDVPKSAVN